MATVGAKNQPLTQATDLFQPNVDINTVSNWVANNYASVKILTGSTLHTAVTGADLFAGLTVYETSTDQFWTYNGSAWYLQPIGSAPRIELTQSTTQAAYFTSGTTRTLGTWTTTQNRGGFIVSSGVVTVPYAGRYNVHASFAFASQTTAAGTRIIQIANAAGNAWRSSTAPVNGNGSYMALTVTGLVCVAGDTLAVAGFQSSGATLDWTVGASLPAKFVIEYVGQ